MSLDIKSKIQEILINKLGDQSEKFDKKIEKCKFGDFGITFELKKEFNTIQCSAVPGLYVKGDSLGKVKFENKFILDFVDVDYATNKVYFFIEKI